MASITNSDGTPDEQVSHGTLVAGLAAATGNNGFGTAGIALEREDTARSRSSLTDGGASVSQVIEGIDYASHDGRGHHQPQHRRRLLLIVHRRPIKQRMSSGILVVSRRRQRRQ
jgi:hypothetical protein